MHPVLKASLQTLAVNFALVGLSYVSFLVTILTAYLTKTLTFTLSNMQVSITLATGGPPQHLSLSVFMFALAKVVEGQTGSFPTGDLVVTITENT